MAHFESMRDDLDRMWVDLSNLFDTVDNDIIKTLNNYGAQIVSINEKMMQTIPEESPANKSMSCISIANSTYKEEKHDEIDIIIDRDVFMIENKENMDDNSECLLGTMSMKRIIYVLCEYNKWLSLQTEFENVGGYDGMYDFINNFLGNGTYSIPQLLNDFYFVLHNTKYNIEDEFEHIYYALANFISKHSSEETYTSIINQYYFEKDSYEKCQTDTQRENFYGKYWNDNQEIVALQILNKIYFYFLHSFDSGYKLTMNETSFIEKRMSVQEMTEETDLKMMEVIKILNDKNIEQKSSDECEYNKYAMNGLIEHQYFYWFEYTNNEWFICAKYSSMKDELLSNNTYSITLHQFNDITEEAQQYKNSQFCKKMNKYDSPVHIQQIMSVLLYTNFNILRQKFLDTFYRKTEEKEEFESNLSLKSRHSNFAIFARLLTEAVQWFGSTIKGNDTFYHIINTEKILFNSIDVKIYIPFSTTQNYNVILKKNIDINDENGMILKMNGSSSVRYFDSSFLSKFVNENESFFFGFSDSNSFLIFADIIDCRIGYKYGIYLQGLNVIYTMINGDWYKSEPEISNRLKLMVRDLILFQLKQTNNVQTEIPKYIAKMFSFYCSNVKEISIDWTSLHQTKHKRYSDWNGFVFLRDIFCLNNEGSLWIKLDVLYRLFPTMSAIKITTTRHSQLCLSQFVLNQILSFVSKHSECALTDISIKKPIEQSFSIQDAIEEYHPQFQRNNWSIQQKVDRKNDKYLILHKM